MNCCQQHSMRGLKVEPIKTQIVPIGAVRSVTGAASDTGSCLIRLKTPSRRIHWTIEIGWTGNPALLTSTWDLYPMMVDPDHGTQSIRLQPVVFGATLPDGYEAESGVKEWEAVLNFATDDSDGRNIFAVVVWEAAFNDMSDEERAYWASLCSANKVGTIDIGISL